MNIAETKNVVAASGRTEGDNAALFASDAYALVLDALNADFGKNAFAVNIWLKPESTEGTQYYLCVGKEGVSQRYFAIKSVDGQGRIRDFRRMGDLRNRVRRRFECGEWTSVTAVVTNTEQKLFINDARRLDRETEIQRQRGKDLDHRGVFES